MNEELKKDLTPEEIGTREKMIAGGPLTELKDMIERGKRRIAVCVVSGNKKEAAKRYTESVLEELGEKSQGVDIEVRELEEEELETGDEDEEGRTVIIFG